MTTATLPKPNMHIFSDTGADGFTVPILGAVLTVNTVLAQAQPTTTAQALIGIVAAVGLLCIGTARVGHVALEWTKWNDSRRQRSRK